MSKTHLRSCLPLSTHSQIGATFSKTILFHKWIPLSITYRPLKGLGPIVQHGLKNRQWNFFPSQILYLTVKKFQPKGRFCIWVRFRKWRMKNFKPRADFAPPTKIAFYTCQKPSHLRPSPAILKSAKCLYNYQHCEKIFCNDLHESYVKEMLRESRTCM